VTVTTGALPNSRFSDIISRRSDTPVDEDKEFFRVRVEP
jgi:hypothetical protein